MTQAAGSGGGRVVRHALVDRLFHWLTAIAVLTLLATGLLPILGIQFAWVAPHWIAGLLLAALILLHLVRTTFWQGLRNMWIGLQDLRDAAEYVRWQLRADGAHCPKPGKYSLAQKLFHHVAALLALTAVITGLLMMVRIDTPLWERNPYWLTERSWGIIYVLHGFAALSFITLIIVHVYFALRPEKLFYTRAMLIGWITAQEKADNHDADRWR